MKKFKILNLYACLGGNRYKWDEVHSNIEVTSVELDPELAKLYKIRFPKDTVIVADAHEFLLKNYMNFDFIWSSPPCPTHSSVRRSQMNTDKFIPKYPSMILYEEIIFLKHHFLGRFVVENVVPYYEPLISAKKRGRHLYWTNFLLPSDLQERKSVGISTAKNEFKKLCKFHDIDLTNYKGIQKKKKIARNLVDYEAGKTILQAAFDISRKKDIKQITMFE
jgi:DNA (cytosine-5)-methyltransferase 1